MTEFEIRRQIEAIRLSQASPVSKARELLRLRRHLATQVQELERTRSQVAQTPDRRSKSMLNRMAMVTESLEFDARESAREMLNRR